MEKSRFLELTGMKEEDFKEGYLDKVNQIEQEGFTFSDYHTENFSTQSQLGRGMFYEPNDFDKIQGTDHQVMTFEKNGENRYLIINEEGQIQSQPLSKLRYYDRENRSRNDAVINGISALKESLDKQGIDISEKQLYLLLDHTMIEDAYLHDNENINMDTIADELVSNFEEMVKKVSNLTQTQQSEIDHELFGCGKDRQSSAMGAIERSLMASINFPDREDPNAYNMYWPTRAYDYESAYEMDDIIDAFTTFTAQVTQKALREDRITLRADAASMQLFSGVYKEAYGENKDRSRTTALAAEKMIEEIKKLPDKEAEKALDNFTRRAYGLNFQYDGYSNINFNNQDNRKPVIKFLHPSITGTVVKMIKEGKDIVPTRINYDLQKIASMIRSTAKDLGLDQETAKKAQENIISQYVDKQAGRGVSYRRLTDLVSPGFLPLDYQNAYDFIIRMAESKASLKEVADMMQDWEQFKDKSKDDLDPIVRKSYDDKLRSFVDTIELNEKSYALQDTYDENNGKVSNFKHKLMNELEGKGITETVLESYPFPDDVAEKIEKIEEKAKETYKEALKETGVLADQVDTFFDAHKLYEMDNIIHIYSEVKESLSSMTDQELIDLMNAATYIYVHDDGNYGRSFYTVNLDVVKQAVDPEERDQYLMSRRMAEADADYVFSKKDKVASDIEKAINKNPIVTYGLLKAGIRKTYFAPDIASQLEKFEEAAQFMDTSFLEQFPAAQKMAQYYQSVGIPCNENWKNTNIIEQDPFYKIDSFDELVKASDSISRCTGLPTMQIVGTVEKELYASMSDSILKKLDDRNELYKAIEEKSPDKIETIKEAAKFITSANEVVQAHAKYLIKWPAQIDQEEIDKMVYAEKHPEENIKTLYKISLDELMANRSPFSFSADEAPSDGTTISETETPSSGAGIEDSSYTQETLTEMEENTEEKTEHSKDSKEQVQQK